MVSIQRLLWSASTEESGIRSWLFFGHKRLGILHPRLLLALFLTACAGLPKFPTETIIEYDSKNKVCGQYKIIDYEHFKVQYVKDIPCPDVFGFSSSDISKVLDWAQDSIKYGKEHCQ